MALNDVAGGKKGVGIFLPDGAFPILHQVTRTFKQWRRHLTKFFRKIVCRAHHGITHMKDRPAGARRLVEWRVTSVWRTDSDMLDLDPKPFGDHLPQRRVYTLSDF